MNTILKLCKKDNIDKNIEINCWIRKKRKLGSMIFMDVYDTSGMLQVVIEEDNKCFELVKSTPKESVIWISGKLVERKEKNDNIPTGFYELIASDLKVYSKSELPPFLIQVETDALEEKRLQYRYLDLRRENVHNNIKFRSKFIHELRSFLHTNDFCEIETPILSKQTPEGARDYLVPTRNKNFYALPQSPQIFKQLLMVSGFQRYFQIARCFRDEDLRLDRQPEFTQLDMEFSFVDEEYIYKFIENMWTTIFKNVLNIELPKKFPRISYKDAIEKYGSDKPDIRYDLEIKDVSNIFKNSSFDIFKNAIINNQFIKAIILPNKLIDKKNYKNLEKYAKDNGAKGLIWLNVHENKIVDGTATKIISDNEAKNILSIESCSTGTILISIDTYNQVHKILGSVRTTLINELKLEPKNKFEFLWVVDWPLYEYSEVSCKYVPAHHPFTSPSIEALNTFDKDKANAKARAYDLVLNGYEIGGGSIRIHDSELQTRLFASLDLSKEEIEKKFGFMINAFKYGVPPHGGIAFGIERILMIILNTDTIRDVIAFPKNSSGYDLMQNAPSDVESELLEELGLKKDNEKNK